MTPEIQAQAASVMEEPMDLATRLKEARTELGLSQKALAEAADISRTTVAHYEQGRREPKPDVLERLAVALDLDAAELLAMLAAESTSSDEPTSADADADEEAAPLEAEDEAPVEAADAPPTDAQPDVAPEVDEGPEADEAPQPEARKVVSIDPKRKAVEQPRPSAPRAPASEPEPRESFIGSTVRMLWRYTPCAVTARMAQRVLKMVKGATGTA